ncbi:MAG: YajQ family cyclic di-GMP-binding protein [Elusimicrobia bacterium RIFCSPLOWO2_02_FULL_39_32]|nr:MAG: YajQ family cyclic di-GMP-binding protein [Elusimicrobia bacterium RIFCSPHIGHO2_02_FULL_39_36]OGR91168.1 MAG: YajQ family cyclic di-GMP-binding protein [Elusimicrobia bacterium RIFCSPLOWO2_02_FULL_39_32]OGS00136.1 MAG: YajQ family cyclic di-GMP-binding protein [Elusimicrobia bacterium RIFCSPLOWO2_12_FULL_39_28]
MAEEFSFDVVSKVDLQEVENAMNQAAKEISTRFDFRGSVSRIEFDKKETSLMLYSDDEGKLKSVVDILQNKMVKRNVSLRSLSFQSVEPSEKGTVKQSVKIKQGITTEKAKEIVKAIKDSKLKITPSIQAEQVRIASKSKDELQSAITFLRAKDFGLDLQFANYR